MGNEGDAVIHTGLTGGWVGVLGVRCSRHMVVVSVLLLVVGVGWFADVRGHYVHKRHADGRAVRPLLLVDAPGHLWELVRGTEAVV